MIIIKWMYPLVPNHYKKLRLPHLLYYIFGLLCSHKHTFGCWRALSSRQLHTLTFWRAKKGAHCFDLCFGLHSRIFTSVSIFNFDFVTLFSTWLSARSSTLSLKLKVQKEKEAKNSPQLEFLRTTSLGKISME